MDNTNDDKSRRPLSPDYVYTPVFPDIDADRAAPPAADVAVTPGAALSDDPAADAAPPPPPSVFAPLPSGVPVPSWQWNGAPPPGSTGQGEWHEGLPGPIYGAPAVLAPRPRTWRDTAFGQWVLRGWPFVLLALSKLKWLTILFKFKAFTTFASMLLSLAVYAQFFGLPFAAGFIALLFIHEMGHAFVMRQQGIKMTPVLFIPMMGAVIGMREMPKNALAEANMALGGPLAGSLGAVGCVVLWQVTGAPIFLALAYSGFLLNLFNLIPVSPLDGGRAMAAISPWGWLVGLVLLVLLFLRVHSLILGFILIVGGLEVLNRWRSRGFDRSYYELTLAQRLTVSVTYFGLALFLAFAMYALQAHLHYHRPV